MNLLSRRRLLPLLLLALVPLAVALVARASSPAGGRVVVLGFDGADSRTVARMIGEGELPHLAQLAEQGTFAPLVSTHPAESAAGWAAINTGTNPVKNNVPSFIKRELPSVSPGFAYISKDTRPIGELEPPWLVALLARGGTGLTVAAGVGGFLLGLGLLAGLLRIGVLISGMLGLVVGAALSFAVHRAAAYVPAEVPDVNSSLLRGPGFWDVAAEGGKRAIVLDGAMAFGRPTTPGARVLAGLGLPDLRGGTNGYWTLYTTDEFADRAGTGSKPSGTGTTYRVDEKDGRVETVLYGPLDPVRKRESDRELAELDRRIAGSKGWKEAQALRTRKSDVTEWLEHYRKGDDAARVQAPLTIERRGERLAITIGGRSEELGAGEWSDWYRVTFEMSSLIRAHAVTRVRVLSLHDPLSIYVDSLHIDPENPPFWQPASSPSGFSSELASWIGGPYETLGWACMTNQIKDKELPVDVFLEDIEFTMGFRRRLTRAALARQDWDVLFSVFSSTDRVQHMMYRFHDPEHPAHDADEASRVVTFFGKPTRLADAIPEIYRQMDSIVGEVLEALRPEDTLLICADHGFTSYRRSVDVNNWLVENGYMALRNTSSGSLGNVDWARTRAYALGLGMVYLNLAGREPQGIVSKEEAIPLLHEIGRRMVEELRDPGPEDRPYSEPRQAILEYAVMSELYSGPVPWDSPDYPCADMQLGTAEYYRTSWGGVMGETRLRKMDGESVLAPVFSNNTNNWSGDHASNSPGLVTGTFFSNKPVVVPEGGVSVMHIAPTVLERLGVDRPSNLDLPPLELRD